MDARLIFIIGYVFFLGFFMLDIFSLPTNMLKKKINRQGLGNAKLTKTFGVTLILFTQILGIAFWFLLWAIPLYFSKALNSEYSLLFWFGTPIIVGVLLRRIISK